MTPRPEIEAEKRTTSPLEAFTGTIPKTKTGPLYSAGLAVVALAMVLLPLIYIGLIGVTAWGVVLHLTKNTWIFEGGSGRGGLGRLIMYLGPAVIGAILVFFMVKPFFAAKVKAPDPVTLDPEKEPLLFAFVRKICDLVGAPMPCRVDVDCQVNASASLRKLWSRELVLTVGLPLAAGLSMRQFAGVLAHEFGHFAQGAGMRCTYVIRTVNFWFSRVVYERDAWDMRLAHWAKEIDLRIGIVLHLARGCVWLTRRVLWILMHAGHAISCFMLRQMEFDADSYETKVAGSEAFEKTALRLRLLNVATQMAYEDVQQSWASKRLPENLPLLIGHKAGAVPDDVRQKLISTSTSEKTRWFDTHPCDADRVREAQRLGERGVFQVEQPATMLFSDFSVLSKTVTQVQYSKHLELEFTEENLMSAEEILQESTASAEAQAMVERYYGGVNISLKPLLEGGELPPIAPTECLFETWREAVASTQALRSDAEKVSAECIEHHKRMADLTAAQFLGKANFKVDPAEFGLPAGGESGGHLEAAAATAIKEAAARIADHLCRLEPFMAGLRQRIFSALRLRQASVDQESNLTPGLRELTRVLAAVAAEMPRANELGTKLKAFALLAQNRANHSNPAQVDSAVALLATEMKLIVGGIQERLRQLPYPFPHAKGALSVADYARLEQPSDNEWITAYLNANTHIDRLFALHYRLVGRVLALAHATEEKLEEKVSKAEKSL